MAKLNFNLEQFCTVMLADKVSNLAHDEIDCENNSQSYAKTFKIESVKESILESFSTDKVVIWYMIIDHENYRHWNGEHLRQQY